MSIWIKVLCWFFIAVFISGGISELVEKRDCYTAGVCFTFTLILLSVVWSEAI